MPWLLYQSRHNPPRWWEHLVAHGMLIGVALGASGIGSMMGVSLATNTVLSRVAELLADNWLLGLALFLISGGALCLLVVALPFDRIFGMRLGYIIAQAVNRIGLIGMLVGWVLRAIALYGLHASSDASSVWLSVCLAIGCALELAGSVVGGRRIERTVEEKVRALNE